MVKRILISEYECEFDDDRKLFHQLNKCTDLQLKALQLNVEIIQKKKKGTVERMNKYKFNISMDCNVEVEAENAEDARMKVINNMDNGDYDHLLEPDGSAYVDDGLELEE